MRFVRCDGAQMALGKLVLTIAHNSYEKAKPVVASRRQPTPPPNHPYMVPLGWLGGGAGLHGPTQVGNTLELGEVGRACLANPGLLPQLLGLGGTAGITPGLLRLG